MSRSVRLSGGNRGGVLTKLFRVVFTGCEVSRFLISKSLDKELSWGERSRLYVHLAICSQCRRYRRQLKTIRQLIRCYCSHHPEVRNSSWNLSAEARKRIKRLLRQKMRRPCIDQYIACSHHMRPFLVAQTLPFQPACTHSYRMVESTPCSHITSAA
jgi:Putative zinc-finger